MKRPVLWIGIVLGLILIVVIGRRLDRDKRVRLADGPAGAPWPAEALWDDGSVEWAVYRTQLRGGDAIRVFETTVLTNAAAMDRRLLVEADDRTKEKDRVPVFEMKVFEEVPGTELERRTMTSVTMDRGEMALRKMTIGVQDARGNSYKEIVATASRLTVESHGYLPGQGDRQESLAWKSRDFALESLPLLLRAFPLEKKFRLKCRVLNEQVTPRVDRPALVAAELKVRDLETIEAGEESIPCYRVELRRGDRVRTYWFERSFPNILVKQEDEEGSTMVLLERRRIPRPEAPE